MTAVKAELYRASRLRVIELVRTADPTTAVPACPSWTVHDLLAHLAGGATDLLAGDVANPSADEHTASQVDQRAAATIDELIAELTRSGEALDVEIESGRAQGFFAPNAFVDIGVHEMDLRGALSAPPAPEGLVLAILDLVFGGPTDVTGSLTVQAGAQTWPIGDGEPASTLTVDPFELVRARFGRRSEAQVRAWAWAGDREAWLEEIFMLPPRAEDLLEP